MASQRRIDIDDSVDRVAELLTDCAKDRLVRLSVEWPSMAAALGDLLVAYGRVVPGPLRHARKVRDERVGNGRNYS